MEWKEVRNWEELSSFLLTILRVSLKKFRAFVHSFPPLTVYSDFFNFSTRSWYQVSQAELQYRTSQPLFSQWCRCGHQELSLSIVDWPIYDNVKCIDQLNRLKIIHLSRWDRDLKLYRSHAWSEWLARCQKKGIERVRHLHSFLWWNLWQASI